MVHHVELAQGEQDGRVPRQDGERLDDQIPKHRRKTEDGNLGVSLHNQPNEQNEGSASMCSWASASWTDLVEHPRLEIAVALPPRILEALPPRAYTLQLLRHIPRRLPLLILDVQIRSGLDQPSDADRVSLDDRPVEWGQARVVPRVGRGRLVEEQVERDGVSLVGCPHEGGVAVRVLCVDRDGLVEDVQERHDHARVGDEVERVEPLRVGEGWVCAMGDE